MRRPRRVFSSEFRAKVALAALKGDRTVAGGKETYNLNPVWHYDGDPRPSLKMLVYLSEVDEYSSPFSFIDPTTDREKTLIGSAGTSVCLSSASIKHCASNVCQSERSVISFLVLRSFASQVSFSSNQPLNA